MLRAMRVAWLSVVRQPARSLLGILGVAAIGALLFDMLLLSRGLFDLAGGTGYHDHNWGFWEGVRWQWGQVQGDDLSFIYGRVFPPADAADAIRVPGFLMAIGSDGVVGYATDVTIEEAGGASAAAAPRRIVVSGRSDSLAVTLDIAVDQVTATRMRQGSFGAGMDFLQLRATYRVSGRAGARRVEFTAPGSAETFRGRHGG